MVPYTNVRHPPTRGYHAGGTRANTWAATLPLWAWVVASVAAGVGYTRGDGLLHFSGLARWDNALAADRAVVRR